MRAISIFKSCRSSLLALLRKEFLSLMGVVTPFLFDPGKIQNFQISRFAAYPFTRFITKIETKRFKLLIYIIIIIYYNI